MPNLVANRQTEVAPIFPNFFRMMPVAVIYKRAEEATDSSQSNSIKYSAVHWAPLNDAVLGYFVTFLWFSLFTENHTEASTTKQRQLRGNHLIFDFQWFSDFTLFQVATDRCAVYSVLLNSTRRTGKDPQNPKNTEWSIGKCFITDEVFYKKHCKRKQ